MSDTKQAKRFFVSGKVQGVGFRYFARERADSLKLTGYARNLPDGRVEVYAIGTSEQLTKLQSEIERGPLFSRVTEVVAASAELDARYCEYFLISYGD